MAADSTVNIDVILHKDQAQQASKELDQTLKDTGKDAGNKAEKSIESNINKSTEKAKEMVTNIKRWTDEKGVIHVDVEKIPAEKALDELDKKSKKLGDEKPKIEPTADTDSASQQIDGLQKKVTKIPKKVRTELIAQAKEQGITNFDQLLKKIPKKQLTELIAKAQKGEVINYEEELRKLPAKLITEVKLNDKASLPLKELQQQANETGHSFSRLKEIIAGTFVGGLAVNGIHAIGNGLREAAKAGMEYNVEQDRMKTVWTALTTEAPKDGKVLINFINDMAQHSIYAADTIDRMAQSFYHVHSSVKETKDWTTAFVRLGSTLHMSNDQLAEAGEQFAKIVAGGKANAEDMSVMINRFPMFGKKIKKATGKSMKQLYELSSQGKLTAKEFTEALDYLSNKYKDSTAEAMTSFTGMSMYIKSRWQVLWGEVMNTSFKANKQMSEDIRDLLSDQMISRYSKMMGQALAALLRGAMNLLEYIGQHKDTLVDLIGNLGKITGIIGATVWHAFIDTVKIIATALGLVKDNGKAAVDPLELLDDVTKALVKNKSGLEAFTRVLITLFAVKKITQFVMWMARARDAVLSFAAAQKALEFIGGSAGPKVPTANPAGAAPLVQGGEGLAAGAGTSMTRGAMLRAAGGRLIKASPYAAGAVMAGTELFSNNSASEKTGGILGAMGGAVGGKALGAAIGTMIAPGMGTAIGGFLGGTAGSFIGQKLGEAIGKGADEHFKAHPITVNTKYKTSTDNKAMDKDLTPSINKVNKTVLRMDVDSASIQKAQQKTDKYFDEMSKKVDSYYKKKADGYKKDEEASKKNLDALVKNGKMSQAEEDKALKKQQENDQKKIKSDDAAAKQRKKVLEQMRKDTNDYYAKVSKIENDANKSEKQKQKELQKAQAAYVKKQYKDQLDANKKITSYVKQGANTQEKIYEQLVKKRGQLDMKDLKATQKAANQKYNAAVKPARKARDEIVKEAEKEYKDTVKTAEKEYKEHHTISKKKYKEIVADAKAQRDGVTKAADDEYNKTTKKASDEHKKVTGEVNKQKDEVIAAANNQAMSHGAAAGQEYTLVNANVSSGQKKTAGTMNGFIKSLNSFFKALNAGVHVPEVSGYAVGTGALPHNQLAMVGEEGPELAHTPKGYEMLGMNGPELRYLSAGTSILTNAQTKTALALNGGKIPGYAKGTGAKIEDFVSGALDKADDALDAALDLVGKGAEEIWSWFKKKLGIDRAVASVDPKWLMQLQSKQETEIGGKAGSSFLKKALDKFLESFSGGQGKMSKGAFAQAAKVAAALMHQSLSASDIERLYWQAMVESTVNPAQGGGIDDHDGTGRPIGLFQFKLGTWGAAVRHLPSGHSNIHSAVDQIMAVLADRTWRSDLAPIGVRRGWSPHGYANGGWADKLSIFGEVPGEPEVAINPARDTSEDHIAEAIEARAKVNPNGFAGNLSKIINEAKQSANNMLPFISTGNNQVQATSNTQQAQPRVDGNINITMNIDSKQVSRAVYPTLKAMRSHEVIINGVGGAVPVGNGQPLGGVY